MRKFFFLGSLMLMILVKSNAQVVINEVCPTNGDINYDPQFFNFSGWIELYNKGNSSVNVGGYFLSNDPANKFMWQIPGGNSIGPKGYLLIWCDEMYSNLHTNFKLDADGEKITLSTSSSALADTLTFPSQYINISYGRTTDGAATRGYLSKVTPGSANSYDNATEVLEDVDFSREAGRYGGTQSISLGHTLAGVSIRYTVNGSEPTSTSTQYSSAIPITKTTTLKAKAFKTGMLPSNTISKTYFINEHTFTLPVVSLSTNPTYLWDNNTIGIYTEGTNGIAGNCNISPMNWNQDWSRHAVFEYYIESGTKKYDQSLDIRIGGACSRNFAQKSFALKARDEYGNNTLDQQLFPSKEIYKYGSFFLNNSGHDFNVTMFRDAILQSMAADQMDIDYMAYQPSVLYLNGYYWGIQNLREKIDGDYIKANFNVDKDDVDLIETWENAIEGTPDVYLSYKDSLQLINLNDPTSFAFIDKHIDVQEYINYLVTEIYYANTDWPGNNIKFWRQRSTNGKFRWILWDLDFGFGLYGVSYSTHPTLNFATDPNSGVGWPNPDWSTLHIRLVLQNPVFRTRFIQTMLTAISTTFKPSRVIDVIDSFQTRIAAEMPYHKQRWGGNIGDWNYEVQRMRDFAIERNPYMIQHTADFFGLNERVSISVGANPSSASAFNFNGVTTNEVDVTYFKGVPYDLKPMVKRGFAFKEWKITKRESIQLLIISKGDTWKYFDQGSLPAANWQVENFNDNGWQQGPAELGYGDGDEATTVSYGADAGNKYTTTYFRKTFTVADTIGLGNLSASIRVDDGAVVYLNGMEIYRINMPGGKVDYSTLALGTPSETSFNPFVIVKGLIKPGQNTITVELHQNAVTSSDISFDFDLYGTKTGNVIQTTSAIPIIADTAYSDVTIEAMFDEVPITNYNIVINEFNATRSRVQDEFGETEDWIELFNAGTDEIDLNGLYLTDNFSNKTKFKITESVPGEMKLASGGYKVFFADEQAEQGSFHLNFKLSGDGEQIGLYYEEDQSILMYDTTHFGFQKEDYSFVRIPNGTGPFKATIAMTPGAENIFKEVTPLTVGVYPNPTDSHITIVSEDQISAIAIYDLIGKQIAKFDIQSLETVFDVDMENFNTGLYIIKVTSGSRTASSKVVKK